MTPANGTRDRWAQARNVLCVRLDTIGDVLMTTPAIRALRESAPGRRTTLLTSTIGAEIAPLVPEADETIAYDAPWMKATEPSSEPWADIAMAERLRGRRFDAAVIFTVYSQNPLPAAMLCHLAGIPLRLAHCRENPYQLLTDWVPETDTGANPRHETERQLDLVAHVGATTADQRLSLRIPGDARERVLRLLGEAGVEVGRPWCVVHAGGSAPSRRYPAEHFARVATELVRAQGWQVVFTGSSEEAPLVDSIRKAMDAPAVSLAGRLRLDQLAAAIELAPVLISNNTAPVHMAAAVGTPVVDVYALTNPQHTPWLVPNRVLSYDVPCRNCYRSTCPEGHHDCLRRVGPEAVVQAALDLASETGRNVQRPEAAPVPITAQMEEAVS